jgi:hypothetical protein
VEVSNKVGPQKVEKHVKVSAAHFKRRCGEEDRGVRVLAEKAYAPMSIGFGVPNMLSFVNDDEIEPRKRAEVH